MTTQAEYRLRLTTHVKRSLLEAKNIVDNFTIGTNTHYETNRLIIEVAKMIQKIDIEG